MADVTKYIDTWNNNMDLLEERLQKLLSIAKHGNIAPSDDEFLRDLDRVFYAWTQVEDYMNIFIANDHLLDPLIDLCNRYSDDLRVPVFIPIVTKLRKAHNELKAMKELFGKSFQEEADELEKQKVTFEKSMHYFEAKWTHPPSLKTHSI